MATSSAAAAAAVGGGGDTCVSESILQIMERLLVEAAAKHSDNIANYVKVSFAKFCNPYFE